jgi:alkylresorcinol/alkylpyrone synthase
VFANSGIRHRYSTVPLQWYDEPHGWKERNGRYIAGALDLLETVAGRALDEAGVGIGELGGVVTVSTTGIATPSLDALLIERMQLPRNVARLPVFGLGCAGGIIGLARAADMAAAMPGKAVLLLVVELCTLSFRRGDRAKSNIVATALFGDGAAAALLRCGAEGPAIVATGEHTWPNSLDIMGWEVAEDGLKAVFSRDIPRLIETELRPATDAFLAQHELGLAQINRFVCHPGGPKVLDAFERVFGLMPAELAEARDVLREFGNMSAASVLFVLERMLARSRAAGKPWGRALLTALGPGFTAGFAVLSEE